MTGVRPFAKRAEGGRGNGGGERLPTRATAPEWASQRVGLGLVAASRDDSHGDVR